MTSSDITGKQRIYPAYGVVVFAIYIQISRYGNHRNCSQFRIEGCHHNRISEITSRMTLSSESYDHDVYISEFILDHIVSHGLRHDIHRSFADISSDYLRSFDDIFPNEEH